MIAHERAPLETAPDGTVRVGGTRVTLDTVVAAFLEGATAEEIAQQYPVVALADVYAAIGYYLHHRSDVDSYLDQRRTFSQHVRDENAARFNPGDLRARLLARRTT